MSKLLKIGYQKIGENVKQFFYDGCHKFYLVEDEKDKEDMFKNGWSEKDLFNIEVLPLIFNNACPLRFINTCKLKTIVPQGRKLVRFTFNDKIEVSRF